MKNVFNKLLLKFKAIKKEHADDRREAEKQTVTNENSPCCDSPVHIAYRGVSDDRLYLTYDKRWQDVKFFKPKGLRVYCKKCRNRIL
jgi:hypothetical protein